MNSKCGGFYCIAGAIRRVLQGCAPRPWANEKLARHISHARRRVRAVSRRQIALRLAEDGRSLVPCSDDDAQAMREAFKGGPAVAEVAVKRPRNVARHRLFWALCGLAAENSDDFQDAEAVASAVKLLAGHFEVAQMPSPAGPIFIRWPKSLSFASMGEEEFGPFFERALTVIASHILPGADLDNMRKEAYCRAGMLRDAT
jgi:hypothetical protein